jgi:hypothetical protein
MLPCFALALLVVTASPRMTPAQSRAPLAQTLDLAVSRAPETVTIGGRAHLVYELHLTNFLRTEIAVTGIQVLDGDRPGGTIADFRGDALAQALGRPGVRGAADTRRIAPASRAVAYFWIDLPPGTQPPRAVRHRVEMQVMGPADSVSLAFEGPRTLVASDEAVVLGPPLRGGAWVAAYLPRLVGGHRTVFYTVDGKARIPGRFAIDWVRLSADGTYTAETTGANDRNGYGAEVLAVADGLVVHAMDDIADNVGTPAAAAHALENATGNFVAIDIGNGRFAFYEHLQHGSVAVKPGDRVRRGQGPTRRSRRGTPARATRPDLRRALSMTPGTPGRRLVRAWLLLAVIDFVWAVALSLAYGRPAMSAFRGVATVALAPAWMPAIAPSAMLGVVLHLVVAFTWATVYVVLQRRSRWLARASATRGGQAAIAVVYGPFIWIVMSTLVIPMMTGDAVVLSTRWAIQLVGHVFFVGMPVVLGAGRHQAASKNPGTSIPA